MSLNPADLFVKLFREDGNNSNSNMNVVATLGSPIDFIVSPPDNYAYEVKRVLFKIRDNSVLRAERFGGLPELANGIQMFLTVPDIAGGPNIENVINEEPIKSNADFSLFCNIGGVEDFGSGDNFYYKIWETPDPELGITILEGQKLIIRISDDLSELVNFEASAQGRQVRVRTNA